MTTKHYYFSVPFTRIFGKHKVNSFEVLRLISDERDYVDQMVNKFFLYLYGSVLLSEGGTKPNCNKDGCVYFYAGEEIAVEGGQWVPLTEEHATILSLYNGGMITEHNIEGMKRTFLKDK